MDTQLTNHRVVAIDGGTATGKGRLIDELSQLIRLKGVPVIHLSTGSLYRAVAYAALEALHIQDIDKALERLRETPVPKMLEAATARQIQMHGGQVWMDSAAVSVEDTLKGPGVGKGASIVAGWLPVRQFVDAITRRQVNEFDGYALIDGRDITHTVVPDAPLKLLLTVAPQIAATRSREHTVEEIVARNEADHSHTHGALRRPEDPGDGVIVLPTDNHTPESVRDQVYKLMRGVWPELPKL